MQIKLIDILSYSGLKVVRAIAVACELILVEEALQFLDDETIAYCNKENLLVVVIYNDVTYAEIIELVSVLRFFNNLYIKQEERVKHIIYDMISNKEKIDTVLTLCPESKSNVVALL